MEYTKEQIERIKLNTKGGRAPSETLAYIAELEGRLQEIDGYMNEIRQSMGMPPFVFKNNDAVLFQQGEELQHNTKAKSTAGGTLRLWIPGIQPGQEKEICSVVWEWFQGNEEDTAFVVDTPDEARALYQALLAIKEVDAD